MLELLFFFPLTKVETLGLEGTLKKEKMEKNTFYHQCPCAAGSTKTVSGHTCVPASIRFGDIGDTKSSILHDGPSEERETKLK